MKTTAQCHLHDAPLETPRKHVTIDSTEGAERAPQLRIELFSTSVRIQKAGKPVGTKWNGIFRDEFRAEKAEQM